MSFIKDVKDLFEFSTKLPIKWLSSIAFTFILMFLLPDDSKIFHKLNHLVSVFSVIIITYLFLTLAIWIWKKGTERYKIRRTFSQLSEQSRILLREFSIQNQPTIEVPIEDPACIDLLSKNIIVGKIQKVYTKTAWIQVIINPNCKKYITEKLFSGLSQKRPPFTPEIEMRNKLANHESVFAKQISSLLDCVSQKNK